ncbi:MAG: hypothetical protein HYY65_02125 [Candidatus Tectomicrobia bacterium]|uniref:Uncharacterized protein n=1 Tax=Tectimicrobiota bacterium TaxID=2528274 RepID=A0A932LZP6_UNCTE|nr:hypothetical protein [Candidatus Tectomicrobia bacterium]
MYEEGKTSKELEDLSRAISEAITKSEHVRKALANFAREKLGTDNTCLVLMLRVRSTGIQVDEVREAYGKGVPAKSSSTGAQHIDGRKLTPLEIAFEEHCIQHFDEQAWLKRLKIKTEEGKE